MPNVLAEIHDAVIAGHQHVQKQRLHRIQLEIRLAYLIDDRMDTLEKRLLWRSDVLAAGTSGSIVEQMLVDDLTDWDVLDQQQVNAMREEAQIWRLTRDATDPEEIGLVHDRLKKPLPF